MKISKQFFARYFMYLIRWQLSTLILAPVIAMFKHSASILGTPQDWIAATIANLIGGLIFFWVDRFIFYHKVKNPIWEVKEEIVCVDCKKEGRGYRLVQAPNGYDKTNDENPEFRCEPCSSKKFQKMNRID